MIENIPGELEKKVIEAAKLYYERFGTNKNITVNEAASMVGIYGIYLNYYFAYTNGIGMPETREDAQKFLKQLPKEGDK